MSVYGVVIGLLLASPWILLGMVILGAASSSVARWLGRRRRPYRIGTYRQPMPRPATVELGQSAVRIVEPGAPQVSALRSRPQAGPADQRRAA